MSPASVAARAARDWSRMHPELAPALARALALVAGVEQVSRDVYVVDGVGGRYDVTIDRQHGASRCSCPAWAYAKGPRPRCKHTLAVALFERSGGVGAVAA